MDAYEKVEIARNPKRKTSLDYIEKIFDEFIELHGDRQFKDDKAIVCGLARIGNQNFTIIAEQKGRTTKENIERNMYELIELIFSYSINDIERIKIKFLKDLIIKLSMLDFYIATSFEKRIISKKKFESTSMFIVEIRKIAYGLVRNETKC